MKKIILLLLMAALLMVCSCSNQANAASLHDKRLGVDVTIGEPKSKIDKDLGSSASGDIDYYTDAGISVQFFEGKAVMLKVSDNRWMAFSGMTVGKDASDLSKTYGADKDGTLTIMYTKNSKVTLEEKSAKTYMTLTLSDFIVTSITITQNK